MAVILFVLLVAIVFGVVGLLVKGLLWLFFIGLVLAIAGLIVGGFRSGRRSRA